MTPVARRRGLLAASIPALVVFLGAYSNSLRNAFHFDDSHVVEQNLFVRDLSNVPRFFRDAQTFSSLPQNATYRPLVSATVAFDYWRARGLDPLQYHITQLALFALLGILVTVFYARLFRASADPDSTETGRFTIVALFAATLYCVHTGNTQVGNYISARSELLAALGVLAAFLVYEGAPRWRRYYLYLIPVIVGALAKNHAVVFAPLLLAYKLLFEEQLSLGEILSRRAWPRVRSALIATLPALILSAALFVFIEKMSPPAQTYGGTGRLSYLATQTWVWVRYVRMYFLPIGLTADTDLHQFVSPVDARVLAGVALLAVSLLAAAKASRSRELRPVAFGILWFWIAIAPTSTVFPLAEVTNDHRAFLGFIGLNAAVVWFAWTWWKRRSATAPHLGTALPVVGCAVLLAHAVATHERNKVWHDDESLWADVVRKSPDNGRGIMNYGLTQMRRGRLVEARDLFLRAQQKLPAYSFLEVNLGVVNGALKDSIAAEKYFQRSFAIDGTQPIAHRLYAEFLLAQGRGPEAIDHLRRALSLSPGETASRQLLMAILAARAADADLKALVEETLRLTKSDPAAQAYARGRVPLATTGDDYRAWFDLGWSLTRSERHLDAALAYRMALARDPSQADALNNLGWTLGRLGFYDDALPLLARAVQVRPDYALARNNMAWVLRMRAAR